MAIGAAYEGLKQTFRPLLQVGQGLALAAILGETTGLIHNQALAQNPEAALAAPTEDADPVLEYELESVPSDSYQRMMAGVSELLQVRTPRSGDMIAIVDPVSQIMGVFEVQNGTHGLDYVLIDAYKVSTGAKGLGNLLNSDRTPTGVFELQNPEGKEKPLGYILGPRKSHRVGKIEKNLTNGRGAALMTTRKVPVNGIEQANRNALRRGVAVHGTNKEKKLGRAASGGCVRMGNDEAVEFADAVAAPGRAYMVIIDPKDPLYKAAKASVSLAATHDVRPEDSLDAQRAREEEAARMRAAEKEAARAKAQADEEKRLADEAARLKKAEEECVAQGEDHFFIRGSCYVDAPASPPMSTSPDGLYLSPYTPLDVCKVDAARYTAYTEGYRTGDVTVPFMYRHLPDCEGQFRDVQEAACLPSKDHAVYYCTYPQ